MQERFSSNRLKDSFTTKLAQVVYLLVVPVFFYAFAIIYRPMDIFEWYDMERGQFAFHITMLSCVLLGSMLITRGAFFALLRITLFSQGLYIAWCALEFMLMSYFVTLYSWLVFQTVPFLDVLTHSVTYVSFFLWIPYLVIGLSFRLAEKSKSLAESPENERIRFYDERKNLRLVVALRDFLYVEAEVNYVRVFYTENGKSKDYLLRTTMKSVEELCQQYQLVRCHRSYIVNPVRVKLLRKDKDGVIYAELDNADSRKIPVTKRYYDGLANLL